MKECYLKWRTICKWLCNQHPQVQQTQKPHCCITRVLSTVIYPNGVRLFLQLTSVLCYLMINTGVIILSVQWSSVAVAITFNKLLNNWILLWICLKEKGLSASCWDLSACKFRIEVMKPSMTFKAILVIFMLYSLALRPDD